MLFEALEPRILLSGDSLLNIAPDPLQDALLDTTPQIVQYAELLETSEQVEQEISQELDPSNTLNADIFTPILTLFVDDGDKNDDVGPTQVLDDFTEVSNDTGGSIDNKITAATVVNVAFEDKLTNNSAVQTEDDSMPIYTNDADLSIEYATSIEIRGPPASETNNTETTTSYVEESEVDLTILSDYAAEMQPDGTLELPGLYLVDPAVDYFDGQVIYLDFNGAQAVTYNGPVVVEGINIPEFSADSAGLTGQEQEIISQILTQLELTFDGSGVIFTTTEPEAGTEYSTIYIGGDDSAFNEFGSFVGLAEKIDAGNLDPSDNAFVFSEEIVSSYTELGDLAINLAGLIAHESAHLLGYAHEQDDITGELPLGDTVDDVDSVALPSAPEITDIWSDHDDFRFIGNMEHLDWSVENTYYALVDGVVDSVDFRFDDWIITDSFGGDGWSAVFDMNDLTTTDQLVVTSDGPGGSDEESHNVDIILLPDWFYGVPDPDTFYGGVTFEVGQDWTDGYIFDITITHFDIGFYTPEDWVFTVPVVDVTLFDLANKRTGFKIESNFTLSSTPFGTVLSEGFELTLKADILDETIFEYDISYNYSDTVEYESEMGPVTISGSIAYGAEINPFFNNDLILSGISGTVWIDPILTIEMPLGEIRVPLLSVPGIADIVFGASVAIEFACASGYEHMLTITPTISLGGLGIQYFEFNPSISVAITGYGELEVLLGAATAGASLTGQLEQGLAVHYESAAGWDFAAPGALTLSASAYYDTLWGFGFSGSVDLFEWTIAEWDFLEGTGDDTGYDDDHKYSEDVLTNAWISPTPGPNDSLEFRIEYINPGNPPQIARLIVDGEFEHDMILISGSPDNGIYSITVEHIALGNHDFSILFIDQTGENHYFNRLTFRPSTDSQFIIEEFRRGVADDAEDQMYDWVYSLFDSHPDAIYITIYETSRTYSDFEIEHIGGTKDEEVRATMTVSIGYRATITEEEVVETVDPLGGISREIITTEHDHFNTFTGEKRDPRILNHIIVIGTGDVDSIIFDGVLSTSVIKGYGGNDTIDISGARSGVSVAEGSAVIYGGDGDDILKGGQSVDEIYGNSGSDTISGEGENDYIEGNDGDDQITGDSGNDYLSGNAGTDTINGNSGIDTIYGGSEGDYIYGGDNRDYLYGDSGGDYIEGNGGDDYIEGGDGGDTIHGHSGNDVIFGLAGADIVYGDEGTDEIYGGSGGDTIHGGSDKDYLYGQGSGDYIEGNGGDDYIEGNEGSDTIHGNSGLDVIYGHAGNDTIYGDEDRDLIYGNSENDELHGGSGNDDIYGSTGDDTIYGDSGNDLIYGNEEDDEIHGGSEEDDIYGGTGEDTIYGDSGNDLIYGNEEDDEIHGGSGEDDIYGGTGEDTIYGDGDNDVIEGNDDDDEIHGGSGEDEIYGYDGNDLIHGNSGDDLIYGGNGSDRIYGDENNDIIYGENESDIIFGGAHDDHIYGQNGDDILLGDDGDAQLSSFATDSNVESSDGNDHIYGEAGSDIIIGGGANDTIIGDNAENGTPSGNPGSDILIGDGGSVTYTGGVVSNISTMDPGEGGADNIEGNEGDDIGIGGNGGDNIYGHTGEDVLLGDNGSISFVSGQLQAIDTTGQSSGGLDYIEGNENNDIIIGGVNGSSDTLYGNAGDDIIIGDNGFIDFNADDDFATLDLVRSATDGLGGGDFIYGNAGSDVILGGTGGDQIQGNDDPDILIGDNADIFISGFVSGQLTILDSAVNTIISTDTEEVTGGADTITGNGADDVIIGGVNSSSDILSGNIGDDIILGDNGLLDFAYNGDTNLTTLDLMRSFADGLGGGDFIYGNAGEDTVIGGTGGDVIYGDDNAASAGVLDGEDILIGDNADIFMSGAIPGRLVILDSAVNKITTTDTGESTGGADTITGDQEGDVIIGGVNGDTLYGNNGDDMILGDNGLLNFAYNGNTDLTTLDLVRSFTGGLGGGDFIYGNAGNDTIIGGTGGDQIQGNDNSDILIGDNADIFMSGAVSGRLTILNSAINKIITTDTDESTGGEDTITGDGAGDVIIGGVNSDILNGNDGDDVILGDNGLLDFEYNSDTDTSTLDLIRSFTDGLGDGDFIYGNAGEDTVIGGTGGDTIYGDDDAASAGVLDGEDILLGDNGAIFMSGAVPGRLAILNSSVNKITTTDTDESTGGADTIIGNEAHDVIFGGVNGSPDILYGNNDNDVILGDNGLLDFSFGDTDLTTLDLIYSFTDGLGGGDFIYGNAGEDMVIGGTGGDEIYGDDDAADAGALDGEDILLGDNGAIFMSGAVPGRLAILNSAVNKITTTDDQESTGGADLIEGNAAGDVVVGGVNSDILYGDAELPGIYDGDDLVIGDNGLLDFAYTDSDLITLDFILSMPYASDETTVLGGPDLISGNTGADTVIGGIGGDTIYGDNASASADDNDGRDILLGDNSEIELNGLIGELYILNSAVKTVCTTDEIEDTGGVEIIEGNAAGDIIAGGVMGDMIYGDALSTGDYDSSDIILGDNARLEWGYQGDPDYAGIEDGFVFDDSLTTLDLITTELPDAHPGGRDTIFGDDESDIIFGGTESDLIYGDDGDLVGTDTNNDVLFGDHGRLYPKHSVLEDFNSENFFAIDTGDADGGNGDQIFGEEGNDILLGQQGDDRMFGGSGDDDMIGGHNVEGGIDELSSPVINANVNPVINDIMDGETGDDALAGDNAIIWRTGALDNPRFRVLVGDLMYIAYPNEIYDDYSLEYGTPDITSDPQDDPDGSVGRTIELLDHNSTIDDMTGARPFGDDYIAGNADDDMLFSELGDDVLHGDGSIDPTPDTSGSTYEINVTDSGSPDTSEILYFNIGESATDGDDYIEGNGGADLIYGGLGQDDIIGGSSSLFGLDSGDERPDGSDRIFGGAGNRIGRNELLDGENPTDIALFGEDLEDRHARDADMIVGDNGSIYRLVGWKDYDNDDILEYSYLQFNYDRSIHTEIIDDSRGDLFIIPRAVNLRLDYIPGIGDSDENSVAHGEDDIVNGESGDDFIHGMIGQDILYGDSEDDDIFGEAGNDWISGGTGDDGILGDDGLIFTSRNVEQGNAKDTEFSEPLYGIAKVDEVNKEITTPGDIQQSIINAADLLKKSVDLTPFTLGGYDIIYGGLGNDFLHGGALDDAISGAEALPISAAQIDGQRVLFYYADPFAEYDAAGGNALGFEEYKTDEFALYDEYDPLRKVMLDEFGDLTKDGSGTEFLLNFEAYLTDENGNPIDENGDPVDENHLVKIEDGNDVIFGDLENDWLVGGTCQDRLFGGYGSDLMNVDDRLDTNDGANDIWDEAKFSGTNDILPAPDWSRGADTAYGGAGRDVLINNTGADRLIDWVGEFNSYIVPYAPYGQFSVSRSLQPHLRNYLYDLSEGDGSDQSRNFDTGAELERNGEPEGELGLVLQQDPDWKLQTGAPDDPQAGNIPGGKRDVMEAEDFNTSSSLLFAVETGSWSVNRGQYQGQTIKGADAISLFFVDEQLLSYYEVLTTINVDKAKAGFNSNGFIIFDYYSETDFKFVGIDVGTDKLQIGQRTADGWIVETQSNMQLKSGFNYNLMIAVNGTTVTLVVNGSKLLSYAFDSRIIDGYSYGLNTGMVGIGTNNSVTRFDNVKVQKLPPVFTSEETDNFSDGVADGFSGQSGLWAVNDDHYVGIGIGADPAITTIQLVAIPSSFVQFDATLNTDSFGGLVFDYYSETDFKFVAIIQDTNQIVIGHRTDKGWYYDTVMDQVIDPEIDYTLGLSLHGNTISVTLEGQVVLGYTYNSLLNDGDLGFFSMNSLSYFDDLLVLFQE
jgi:Ca2+-binding RTX toxin-like protein